MCNTPSPDTFCSGCVPSFSTSRQGPSMDTSAKFSNMTSRYKCIWTSSRRHHSSQEKYTATSSKVTLPCSAGSLSAAAAIGASGRSGAATAQRPGGTRHRDSPQAAVSPPLRPAPGQRAHGLLRRLLGPSPRSQHWTPELLTTSRAPQQ